ncbi:hypothetical protein BC936DRAFT_145277 [Jimgerdemannia flammicorona]|uniref:Inhibitor I9 domain-containing protein n=1 Tax=Jimgerdemannia flammicorona TaxID=994334 RepID=A0A433DAF1_9FUNG|nr:hypothetical protein BC936DRAFT_145277 [Jimgerdemannia flammicorona]
MRSLLHPPPGTTAAFLLFVSIAYLSLALAFNIDTSSTRTLPNTYIVEFEAPPQSFETVQEMKMNRQSFFRRLDERNIFYHVRQEYELMNAVSIQFDKPENAYEVSEMPEVLKMWPVVRSPTLCGNFVALNAVNGVV